MLLCPFDFSALTMKSILKGSNYMGIKSRTKLYEKKGDKSTAISDFFALEPSQIIHRVS